MTRLPGQPVRIRTEPTSPIPGAGSPPKARSAKTPLIDELPAFLIADGYFNEIPLNTSAWSVASGNAAWFGLNSVRIDEDLGQEGAVLAIAADLRPCDVSAAGMPVTGTAPSGATARAWGDVLGITAGIVVGVDLPCELATWTQAPVRLPGLTTASNGQLSARGLSPYLWRSSFPSGKFSDTIPQRNYLTVSTAPMVRRLTRGHRLDVAFVLRGDYATAATSGSFVGFADIAVTIARRFGADPFQQG